MTGNSEIITMYKDLGETPLECLLRYKAEYPDYKDTKMTYLGRLDPTAEGLLLVLAGDTRARSDYLGLDKTYEFEVLWGFKSDTYDILGKVVSSGKWPQKIETKMPSLLKKIQKKTTQMFPLFSSKSFGGDFLKARGLKIEGYDLPEKRIKIFSFEHIHTRSTTGREILGEVTERVALVKGDFRQAEVLSSWRNLLGVNLNEFYLVSKFKADVSSGTYIRGLANDMGELLGTGALAWSIKRTRVGDYKV